MAKKIFFTLFLGFCGLAATWAQIRMIPHVTRPTGGFSTRVQISNLSVIEQRIILTPYNEAGQALTPYDETIGGQTTLSMPAGDLFADGDLVSHFAIESSAEITVDVNYDFAAGNGSPALARESDQQAAIWRVTPGNWDLVFDGVAVINAGEVATDVWLIQKNLENEEIKAVQIATGLAPHAKLLHVIGSPLDKPFSRAEESYFEISATQPMALTALRGTLGREDVGLLWANQALGISQAATKRDDRGVWFINGGDFYDGFEAMGYNVATDRLWQAELFRRNATGRLSELLGESQINTDVAARTLGYSQAELEQAYEDLDDESKIMIKAYVDGFNRRISQVNSKLALIPWEFRTLGRIRVETWSIIDVLSFMAALQRNFNPDDTTGLTQLNNLGLLQKLTNRFGAETGARMFEDLRWTNDPDAPTMVPDGPVKQSSAQNKRPLPVLRAGLPDFQAVSRELGELYAENTRQLKELNAFLEMGSYAWAVSGSRTESGNPIIYSGPQMGFSFPAIIAEGAIKNQFMDISGMTVPGTPTLIVGRTPHHAWSMQVGHANMVDLYIEDPADVVLDRVEVIRVFGGSDVNLNVFRGAHGPLISQNPPTSLKYSHRGQEFNVGGGLFGLYKAQSMEEFGAAIDNIAVSQHFCYVDRDGNIAYWMSGHDPIRPPEGDYRFPQGSLEGPIYEYDVNNYHPLVHASNPDQGFFAGWNNKARADYDDVGGLVTYGPFHRASVIQDFLKSSGTLSFEEIRDFAIDIAATNSFGAGGNPWPLVADAFKAAVTGAGENATRAAAIALLDGWDGHYVDGGPSQWLAGMDRADGWILMNDWILTVLDKTFDDELDPTPPNQNENGGNLNYNSRFNVLVHALDSGSSLTAAYDWFQNLSDSAAPQNAADIIVAALDEVLADLGPAPWGTGTRGLIVYGHPLLGVVETTPFGSRSTYAHCIEMGPQGPVRIESIFPLGQSGSLTQDSGGNPIFNEFCFSYKDDFDNFNLREFPLFVQ